jgi:hypothetical protein
MRSQTALSLLESLEHSFDNNIPNSFNILRLLEYSFDNSNQLQFIVPNRPVSSTSKSVFAYQKFPRILYI